MNVAEATTALRIALQSAGVTSFCIHIDEPAEMASLQKSLSMDGASVVEGFHRGLRHQVTLCGVPFSAPARSSAEPMF